MNAKELRADKRRHGMLLTEIQQLKDEAHNLKVEIVDLKVEISFLTDRIRAFHSMPWQVRLRRVFE